MLLDVIYDLLESRVDSSGQYNQNSNRPHFGGVNIEISWIPCQVA